MRKLLMAGLLTLAVASGARAQVPACNTVSADPTKLVYVAGSSALRPLLKVLGPKLAAQAAPNNYTIVYYGTGSCNGVNAIAGNPAYTAASGSTLNYYPATYTDTTQPEPTCTTSAAQGFDLGISDVFVSTCTNAAVPAGIGDALGPAQAMAFVVPTASSQQAINAEEAYIALGFPNGTATSGGTTLTATPWTDVNFIFTRSNSSGTKNILANVIGVPVAKWPAQNQLSGSGAVFNAVATSSSPEKTIGILGVADITDPSKVRPLAFSAYGQKYAYFPDSTVTAKDKRNVRDGHYSPIGYAHLISAVDANNNSTKPGVDLIVKTLTGATNVPGVDLVSVSASSGVIPQCAMKVKRTAEGGDLSAFAPPSICGCGFEKAATGAAPSTCVACQNDQGCSTGQKCNSGYCEAR